MVSAPGLHPSPATQAQESFPAGEPQQLPYAAPRLVHAAGAAVPVALPAPAGPGAPTEESSELDRPSAPPGQVYHGQMSEPHNDPGEEVDYGDNEEDSPDEAEAAGEEEAGSVVKDCWDRGLFWVKRPVISQSSASHHSATSQLPVWRESAIL